MLRKFGIKWKYPELIEGPGQDYFVYNHRPDGSEQINWNTDKYPKPTEKEMISWDKQSEYLRNRVYDQITEQLDRLYHDIDSGKLDKTGDFYLGNKIIKDENPKGV